MQTDTSNTYAAANRPNLLRDPNISTSRSKQDMLNGYFDITAFQAPAVSYFGAAARNLGYGPGMVQVDLSLNKKWRVTERFGLLFRLDMFNLPNHANFANPNTSMGSGGFGAIRSTVASNTGRLLQFNMRFEF